jgi:hypothetical protein
VRSRTSNMKWKLIDNLRSLFISAVKGPTVRSRPETGRKTFLSTVVIPYVKVMSEKFRCIGKRYNIRTIFETRALLDTHL